MPLPIASVLEWFICRRCSLTRTFNTQDVGVARIAMKFNSVFGDDTAKEEHINSDRARSPGGPHRRQCGGEGHELSPFSEV